MEKCHCAGVRFETVVEVCKEEKCDFLEAAKKLDVSETCRACKEDLENYYENQMQTQKMAS